MKNVVITGAGGYIGSILTSHLSGLFKFKSIIGDTEEKKYLYRIKAFDNFMYDQAGLVWPAFVRQNVSVFNEDILLWSEKLKQALAEADYIICLAAIVGAPACDKQPELSEKINFEWYKELLNYMKKDALVIFPNTNSGYGTTGTEACTEETPLNPISLYGIQKQKAESFLMENLDNIVCLRLATLFGRSLRPRMDLLVNSLLYEIVKNDKIEIFNPNARRNYIHVEDIVYAICRIMNDGIGQKDVYNLGNDKINSTKLELVNNISKLVYNITGKETKIEHVDKEDPDKRDYIVSSKKFYEKYNFNPVLGLELVGELIDLCKILGQNNNHQLRNY